MKKTIHLDKDFIVVDFTSKLIKNNLYNSELHVTVHLKNSKTKQEDIYEYIYDYSQNCCERFGWSTSIDEGEHRYNDTILPKKIWNKKTITTIEFNSKSKQINGSDEEYNSLDIIFKTNKQVQFMITFFNEHNGYYKHKLYLNLYENKDKQPMNIYTTYL